jgi:hypothetical protein
MAASRLTRVRRVGRELLAVAFWLHAFYATVFLRLPSRFAIHSPKYLNTLVLGLIILFYSVFAEFEWFSMIGDCFYIYLWPCFALAKFSWLATKSLYKFVRSRVVIKSPDLITLPIAKPIQPTPPAQEKPDAKLKQRSTLAWIAKPFTEFSLLWSLLVLTTDNRLIIVGATLVALISGGRAIYALWDFTSDASSWIETLKGSFANSIAIHVGKVRAWEEMSQIDEVTKAANALKMLESVFTFIAENKQFLARATALVAVCISVIFYGYISFVFSCVYVGLAKVQGISWAWPASMVTSLYMPFAYTNLPRNIPIELIGGLQALAVLLLGWNVGFRHMTNRFERIALAADELRGSFEDRVLGVKYSLIKEQAAKAPAIVATPAVIDGSTAKTESSNVPLSMIGRNGFRQPKKKKGR